MTRLDASMAADGAVAQLDLPANTFRIIVTDAYTRIMVDPTTFRKVFSGKTIDIRPDNGMIMMSAAVNTTEVLAAAWGEFEPDRAVIRRAYEREFGTGPDGAFFTVARVAVLHFLETAELDGAIVYLDECREAGTWI